MTIGYQPPERLDASASAVSGNQDEDGQHTLTAVNDLVATSVAANIAQTAGLPVATNVTNLSQSVAAENTLVKADDTIIAKPQIVEPTAGSREIVMYKAKPGDTVKKIAKQYNISVRTVKWTNDLDSDAVEAGRTLKILPVDGVLYTVSDGDTVDKVAAKYKANKEQLVAFNDLELSGLKKGQRIIIPSGTLPEEERPGYVAPQPTYTTYNNGTSGTGGVATAAPQSYNARASVGNRYAYGYCTWYAYERRAQLGRPVGSFWGNAATWGIYASSSGYSVNFTPAPGAVMVNGGGYGHVAIVESVDPGKSITISEMNGYRFGGGFNIVGRGTISWGTATSGYYRYIH